jgi:hypothetical protein
MFLVGFVIGFFSGVVFVVLLALAVVGSNQVDQL